VPYADEAIGHTPGGVLITRYVRSGEVRTGTFE